MKPTHYSLHTIPLALQGAASRRALFFLHQNEPEALIRWSINAPETLLVFVHGFNSTALGAWHDFDRLVVEDGDFARSDICFFQYDGLRRQVLLSSAVFRAFLLRLLTEATDLANSDTVGRRSAPTAYTSIVIAAHSTGAVIVRQALADIASAEDELKSFSEKSCRTLMFAPAYCGAKLSELLSETLAGGGISLPRIVSRASLMGMPVVSDLAPESGTLRELKAKVLRLLENSARPDLLTPSRVTIGDRDGVICPVNWYPMDPPITALVGHDHVSICKPKTRLDDRYRELKSAARTKR